MSPLSFSFFAVANASSIEHTVNNCRTRFRKSIQSPKTSLETTMQCSLKSKNLTELFNPRLYITFPTNNNSGIIELKRRRTRNANKNKKKTAKQQKRQKRKETDDFCRCCNRDALVEMVIALITNSRCCLWRIGVVAGAT